jgi:transposase
MGKVIRVQPHLTVEEIDERLKQLHDFWRIRRWMIIRQALVDPVPAKAIALRVGLSIFTVRDLIEAYNRQGPEALETAGKGQRQHAYLSVGEEQTVLSPFLEASQAGHIGTVGVIKNALESRIGHPIAASTVYRMLARHQWRKVVPRPRNPRSSKADQEAFKKPFLV